jgi:hypothetical protein
VCLARQRQIAHDGEVLAVATLLHGLDLPKAFRGTLRFEVEGANRRPTTTSHETLVNASCGATGDHRRSTF